MNVNDILSTASAEQLMDARDWASDCMGKSAGVKVSAETAVRYVERNYPGGWEGFLREIYPQEAAAPVANIFVDDVRRVLPWYGTAYEASAIINTLLDNGHKVSSDMWDTYVSDAMLTPQLHEQCGGDVMSLTSAR